MPTFSKQPMNLRYLRIGDFVYRAEKVSSIFVRKRKIFERVDEREKWNICWNFPDIFQSCKINLCSIRSNPNRTIPVAKNHTKIKPVSKMPWTPPKYSTRNQCPKLILFKPKQRILPIHPRSKQSLSSIPAFAASFMHRESRAPCNYPE